MKTIGTYPEMSIDQAGELVSRMNRVKSAGHNPVDPNCEITEFKSLGELFERYLRLHGKPYRRSWKQDVRIFHNHLEPLRDREIGTLTRVELQELHARIGGTWGKQVANRVRSILHVLFKKAIEWGYGWPNPVAKIKPYKKPQRERFLQPEELPRFFKTLNKTDRKGKVFEEGFSGLGAPAAVHRRTEIELAFHALGEHLPGASHVDDSRRGNQERRYDHRPAVLTGGRDSQEAEGISISFLGVSEQEG